MAARSPSPNLSRSSNTRTPENSNALRRSFNGGSGGHVFVKQSISQDSLQKGAKPAARSPVVNSTKNFMAPTISAASKAIAVSPRRRILGELNENEQQDFSGSQEFVVKKEVKKPVAATTACSPTAMIAPIDADPSFPPYDPKTNYLSPRPRFLHYKPNPRIEHYLRREEDGEEDTEFFELGLGNTRPLEYEFSSESSGDTSVETLSSLKDTCEELISSKENPVVEEVKEEVKEEEVKEEEEELEECHTPEPEMHSRSNAKIPRRSYFPRSGIVLLLLISVFTCCFVPMLDSSIKFQSATKSSALALRFLEDFNFRNYVVEFATIANVEFLEVANRIQDWSNPTSFFSNMPPSLKETVFCSIPSANLSASKFEQPVDSSPVPVEIIKEDEEHELEQNVEAEQINSLHQSEKESEINVPIEEEKMVNLAAVAVEHEIEYEAEHQEKDYELEGSLVELDSDDLDDQMEESSAMMETKQEDVQNVRIFSDNLVADPEVNEDTPETVNCSNDDHPELTIDDHQSSKSLQTAIILTSFVVAIVFTIAIKKKSPSFISNKRTPVTSICGSSEKPLNCYYVEDMDYEQDIYGDSGTSEMSSSLQTTSSRGRGRLSTERKARRNSTFSSSTSYGSFTTYERLPAKKGSGVDGEVTPVRRSSRIRQLTSP